MPAHTHAPRTLALALLAAAAAALTGCPPKDSARNDDAPGKVEIVEARPADAAAPTDSDAAAGAANPELKGLDPAPPLSRTHMGNGLVIEDLKMGTGDIVWPEGKVRLSIKGWSVATGLLYWDTETQGGPRDIELAKAMKGLREGVPGMRVGGKRRLTIPADRAYGFREVKNDKDEVVVPLATPIVLEVEAIEALSKLRLDPPAGSEGAPTQNDFAEPR